MKNRVLLVIDMNKDFTQEGGALFFQAGADIVDNINKAITEIRKDYDNSIIFANDLHVEDDDEFKLFPPHCIEGTPGPEVNDGLDYKPDEDTLLYKTTYNAFANNYFESYIEGYDEILVVGVLTSVCVMETVAALYYMGYKTVVDRRCVADLTPEAHEDALVRMKTLFGTDIIG